MSDPCSPVPSLSGAEAPSLSSGGDPAGMGMAATLEDPAILLLKEVPTKKQAPACMVNSCGTELRTKYEARYRLCTTHMKAPQFKIDGKLSRFCQKCGKFQPLSEFEDSRRSCRASLDRHNAKQRTLRLKKAEAHMAAQMAAAVAFPHFLGAPGQMQGAFLPPAVLEQLGLAAAAAAPPPPPLRQPPRAGFNYLTLLQAAHQGLKRANDAAVAAAFSAALLGASAAAPAAASAAPAPPTARPAELEQFLGDFLLEPSIEVEELGLGLSDPTAMPPILRLPEPGR